jgi:hypothetical protein
MGQDQRKVFQLVQRLLLQADPCRVSFPSTDENGASVWNLILGSAVESHDWDLVQEILDNMGQVGVEVDKKTDYALLEANSKTRVNATK